MIWTSLSVLGGVLALNEQVSVCPSSIHVELPNATTTHTVAITLTNTGSETANFTLLPNDTFNNPREKVWRQNEARSPLLIRVPETTTTTSTSSAAAEIQMMDVAPDSLSEAELHFINSEVIGHGSMISHGDIEKHPALGLLSSRPNSLNEERKESRPKYNRKGGATAIMNWHKVVMRPRKPANLCSPRRDHKRLSETLCPTITSRITECVPKTFWLDYTGNLELQFPATCTESSINSGIEIYKDVLDAEDVAVDEVLTVDGSLRGLEAMTFTAQLPAQQMTMRAQSEQSFNPEWPSEWGYQILQYANPLLLINATVQWPKLSQYSIADSAAVMVIDIFAQLDHEDLKDNYAVNEIELNGIPGVDDDDDGVIDNIYGLDGTNMELGDPSWVGAISHGTSVCGLVAARPSNDVGASGIAPNTRILPCGAGNSTMSMLATVSCMTWALDNAKRFNIRVINHSYTGAQYSTYQADTFGKMQDLGMVHTVATGNSNKNLDEVDPPTPLLYLATEGYFSMIGIGRLDGDGNPAPSGFSTEWTNFYMPGELMVIVPPDGSQVALGSGTSFAAPTTAGVIAGMFTIRPELDIFDVLWVLENSIIKNDNLTTLTKWGGYVNASLALQYAQGTWIKPVEESDRYVTLAPGESKTIDFEVTLQPDGFEAADSRTAYISILGQNTSRLSNVYKMGEVPVTVQLGS